MSPLPKPLPLPLPLGLLSFVECGAVDPVWKPVPRLCGLSYQIWFDRN